MALANALDRFWRWWSGELRAFAAPYLARLAKPAKRALLRIEADRLVLLKVGGNALQEVSRVPLAATDELARSNSLKSFLPGAGWHIELLWPAQSVLMRDANLPALAAENLHAVLEFEIDRLTPFKATQIYFDAKPAQLDALQATLRVPLACTLRAPLDRALEQVKAHGLTVSAVVIESEALAPAPRFNLLPKSQQAAQDNRVDWLNWGLAGVAGVLLLVAVAYPIWAKRQRLAALAPLVERAKKGAAVVDRINEELDRRIDEYNYLLTRRQGQLPVIDVLEQVTRLLPDGAYLQQFEVKQGKSRELIVQGEMASGTKMIELLEQSGLVQNTAFKSPLTKGAAPNTDRFHVGGDLLPRPLPEPIPEETLLAEARAVREGPGNPAGVPAAGARRPPDAKPAEARPVATPPGTPVPAAPVGEAKPSDTRSLAPPPPNPAATLGPPPKVVPVTPFPAKPPAEGSK